MKRARVVALAVVLAGACSTAAAQIVDSLEIVRLVSGTMLKGHVVSADGGKLRIAVQGVGEIVVDSAAIASRGPVPPAPPMPSAPSPWSGTASIGFAFKSEILPGVAGTQLDVEIKLGVARRLRSGMLMLDGTLGYSRLRPAAATTNQWAVGMGWRRMLSKRFMVLTHGLAEANRVQEVSLRAGVLAGVGAYLVQAPRISLVVAPGVGYLKSQQTDRGSIIAFAAGQPSGAAGPSVGVHDMFMVQVGPMLSVQQSLLWLHTVHGPANSQMQLDTRLVGMVNAHLGLMIVLEQHYDSSMPEPVHKTVRSINSGVQVKF